MLTTSMAQGLGMSSEAAFKLGGALGIAAVAVNTWVSHWEDVKEVFAGDWTHGASGVIRDITDALLTGAASLANFDRGLGIVGLTAAQVRANQKGHADLAAQKDATAAAVQAAGGAVAGVKGEGDDARGGLFREALAKYGGGERLRNEMLAPAQAQAQQNARFRVKANPKLNLDMQEEIDKAKKKALDSVNLEIANALKGNADAIDRIAKGRPEMPNAVDLKQQAIEGKGREHERAFAAKDRELGEALTRQGREGEAELGDTHAQRRDAEARRFTGALAPTLGQEIAKPGGISDEALDAKIKAKLRQAGVAADDIGKMVDQIRVGLKEEVEHRINDKMLGGGLTRAQAGEAVVREDKERSRQVAGQPKAEMTTTEDYLNKLLVASVTAKSGDDTIPKDQLQAQKDAVAKLEEVRLAIKEGKAAAGPATFARGR